MRYHLMGIGGVGMSALARILKERGCVVSGSDKIRSQTTTELEAMGIKMLSSPPEAATLVYSSAIAKEKRKGLHRSELLKELVRDQKLLAVAGTHGKTTTAAMLTHVLQSLNLDPSFAIGGFFNKKNGGHGSGDYFVAEADESDGSFLNYHPHAAILTSGDLDHIDYWKTHENLTQAYLRFGKRASTLIWNHADFQFDHGKSYGFSPGADYRILDVKQVGKMLHITLENHAFSVRAIGKHNALNATAVFALCKELGIDPAPLHTFTGVARRQEIIKEQGGVLYVDDYAHHPVEVRATLSALKDAYPERRLVALFQPHRYSRLAAFFDDFKEAFTKADLTLITPVYAAGEPPAAGLDLAAAIPSAICIHDLSAVRSHLRVGDVLVTMGAGDITEYGRAQLKVAVLYGGKSLEHEISKRSAECIAKALPYDVVSVPVDRSGQFDAGLLKGCDIAFPVFHGPNGEDGLFAAYLEARDIPFVGCDFRSCAVCMDKIWAKQIARAANILVAPFTFLNKGQTPQIDLRYPLWVKGAHLGSSIGIYKVNDESELMEALSKAFALDDRLIIEEHICGRELEVAVLDTCVCDPGEILLDGQPYLFELKYDPSTPTTTSAGLDEKICRQIKEISAQLFQLFHCSGWCRFDFLYEPERGLFFSEANPIPGCTPTSLFPKMCAKQGISYVQMLERLIDLGLRRALV